MNVYPIPESGPVEVPAQGFKLTLRTGRRGRPRTINVSPEAKHEDWLRYDMTASGHTTLKIVGLGPSSVMQDVKEIIIGTTPKRQSKTERLAEEQAARDAAAAQPNGEVSEESTPIEEQPSTEAGEA
ncbi:MAG: hypothetical protein AAGF11_54470 [Myxococcota bacterium]